MYRNQNDKIWYWIYAKDDYNNLEMFYDVGLEVRLKVVEVIFKNMNEISQIINMNNLKDEIMTHSKPEFKVDLIMEVIGAFDKEGLGPLKWWNKNE